MTDLGGLLPVAAVAVLYAIGIDRMWTRAGRGRLVSRTQVACFASGLLVTAVALGPPLDHLADGDLVAHMTQHVILIWLAAPLLVAGSPLPTLLWVLDDPARLRVQRVWRRVHRNVAGPAWPLWVTVAVLIQAATIVVWHLPVAYQAAVRNPLVHSLEHAAFLGTAMFFWWTIAGAVRRTRYGAGLLVVFVAKLPGLVIGVGMTISVQVWYPVYGRDAEALTRQQVAGVIMWVGGGMVATAAALVLFANWFASLERATPGEPARPALVTESRR